jgi:hypothetical protein
VNLFSARRSHFHGAHDDGPAAGDRGAPGHRRHAARQQRRARAELGRGWWDDRALAGALAIYDDPAALLEDFERVFNISLSALVGRSRKNPFHPFPVYEARHGGRFFAVAQEPAPAPRAAGATQVAPRSSASLSSASRSALDELELGDPSMARNVRAAKRVASRDVPILLIGETGTGKELFARALHAASERAEQPFIAVNCAAIPEARLQVEIVQAYGGTLFLDEIGELPCALQTRLLHVLEERKVTAPGSEARKLGVSRNTLYRKMHRLGIPWPIKKPLH